MSEAHFLADINKLVSNLQEIGFCGEKTSRGRGIRQMVS